MIRIVKMTFLPDQVKMFLKNFDRYSQQIRNVEGVAFLKLLQDKNDPTVCFTYSGWESEEKLNVYRASPLFKGIWNEVKPMFREKAEAWSTSAIREL